MIHTQVIHTDSQVIREQAPVAIGMVPGGEQGVLVKNILQAEKDLKVGGVRSHFR